MADESAINLSMLPAEELATPSMWWVMNSVAAVIAESLHA
jgi:hypothetical protein